MNYGWQSAVAGPAVRFWGRGANGINQGIRHYYQYWHNLNGKRASHIVEVANRLKIPLSEFSNSATGFYNYTMTAVRTVLNPQTISRTLSGGRTAFFWARDGVDKGIVIFYQNGKLQSMFAASREYFMGLQ
ncbi:MAG: hypothetical protein KC618_07350 [Candidatus Omnitrophica bacterium]|nr:hypothetical protein [Candidatus Omnitrophota bacterium]